MKIGKEGMSYNYHQPELIKKQFKAKGNQQTRATRSLAEVVVVEQANNSIESKIVIIIIKQNRKRGRIVLTM